MNLLYVPAVSFSYTRDRKTLYGIDLTLNKGANLGIVGESGSGKTTLLRLLLGLNRPSQGAITVNGRPLDPTDRAFMRGFRRTVQAVFQDPYSSLDPRQSVFDIIAEPLRSLKIPGDLGTAAGRSEGRRGGKGCASQGRTGWSAYL